MVIISCAIFDVVPIDAGVSSSPFTYMGKPKGYRGERWARNEKIKKEKVERILRDDEIQDDIKITPSSPYVLPVKPLAVDKSPIIFQTKFAKRRGLPTSII
ncbi:hypothetical protein M0804_014518 [Polistes exclamans]|nr:hypothetical protein M0804_014521 [Polistes exclamans]KAI4475094.1 hypothetical protein M0804_014518 [Polistes exclamans]